MAIYFSYREEMIDRVELDILRHARISGILSFKVDEVGDGIKLSAILNEGDVSMAYLINAHAITDPQFIKFLSDLEAVQKQLESHLLRAHQIYFTADSIVYRPTENRFLFTYLPTLENFSDFTCIQMVRHLFIETGRSITSPFLPYLQTEHFSLENLIAALATPSYNLKKRPSEPFYKNITDKLFSKKATTALKKVKTKEKSEPSIAHLRTNPIQLDTSPLENSKTTHAKRFSYLLDRDHPNEVYTLYFDYNVIGRASECNVMLSDSSISRRHAAIVKKEQAYFLEDLASRNGCTVNGLPVEKTQILSNGDVIQFGEKELVFIR